MTTQLTSNLTTSELRNMFNPEFPIKSPLMRYIEQTSNNYLQAYQGGRTIASLNRDIRRKVLLIWKEFLDKYGPNRDDMNEIKERSRTNNYNLRSRGLLRTYGAFGALDRELLRWNKEECNILIDILEYEEQMNNDRDIENNITSGGWRTSRKRRKSKKSKRRKSKKSKRRKSKKSSKRRKSNRR